jgi:DNA-binding protein HU-beta
LTKTEIVEKVALRSTIEKEKVHQIIDTFLTQIRESVESGEPVHIRSFGTFFRSEKKPRSIHSPIAGRVLQVPGKITLGFRASRTTEKEITTSGA